MRLLTSSAAVALVAAAAAGCGESATPAPRNTPGSTSVRPSTHAVASVTLKVPGMT